MLRGVVAIVALMLTICPAYAQVEQTMHIGGDTLTYRYVPADQTHAEVQTSGVVSGRSILDYLTFGDRELNPGASFTIFGTPFYNQEQGWGIAASGVMNYRTRTMTPGDTPSSLALRLSASLSASCTVELTGENWLGGDRHRVGYGVSYTLDNNDIWGLDFDTARGSSYGSYSLSAAAVEGAYGYRVTDAFMVGLHANYRFMRIYDPSEWADKLLADEVRRLSMVGVGVDIEFDTRCDDGVVTRGLYLVGSYTLRNYLLGDIPMGHNVTLRFDYYQPLWRGATLVLDLLGEYNSAGTPWMLRSVMGGEDYMRGYYVGRYIGDNMLSAQLELRQHIWQGLGVAAWGGGGALFSADDPFAWRKVLPTYGVGLRWGMGGGASLCIDMAFGKGSHAIIAGFREVF